MLDRLSAHQRERLKRVLSALSPVSVAFFGSLLLSLVAVRTSPTLNRDGMLYIDTARVFLSDGLDAAITVFNWPFFPILIAFFSKSTGLGLEEAGQLLNALFLAGTCGLMIACVERKFPESVWLSCLALLALPSLNHYRSELLREYGCWFFFTLAFWLAIRWSEKPRWSSALAVQFVLGLSALFRPEVLTYFFSLTVWQLFSAPKGEKSRRTLMIGVLPLVFFTLLVMLFFSGLLESGHRLAGEFGRINVAQFDAKAQVLAGALIPYARDQAGTILFMGSVAIIPLKFVRQLGLFVVPVLFLFSTTSLRSSLVRWQPFSWLFLTHLLVLVVFVLDKQFLAGRYVIVLQLLAVPLIGYGLWLLLRRFPKWNTLVVSVAVLIMFSNVVTLGSDKQHFVDAGRWLARNATESPRVYIESPRAAYYAGWRFSPLLVPRDRTLLPNMLAQKQFDLVVLEIAGRDTEIDSWMSHIGLQEIKRFGQANRSAIIFAKPYFAEEQVNSSNTERMRENTGSTE